MRNKYNIYINTMIYVRASIVFCDHCLFFDEILNC